LVGLLGGIINPDVIHFHINGSNGKLLEFKAKYFKKLIFNLS
jgi:hypothetical protein